MQKTTTRNKSTFDLVLRVATLAVGIGILSFLVLILDKVQRIHHDATPIMATIQEVTQEHPTLISDISKFATMASGVSDAVDRIFSGSLPQLLNATLKAEIMFIE